MNVNDNTPREACGQFTINRCGGRDVCREEFPEGQWRVREEGRVTTVEEGFGIELGFRVTTPLEQFGQQMNHTNHNTKRGMCTKVNQMQVNNET